jgi:hypothetical protein
VRLINKGFIVVTWQSNLDVNVAVSNLTVTHHLNALFLLDREIRALLDFLCKLLHDVVIERTGQGHIKLNVVAVLRGGWSDSFS